MGGRLPTTSGLVPCIPWQSMSKCMREIASHRSQVGACVGPGNKWPWRQESDAHACSYRRA
eukprot:10638869-Lingulodinium_polyedra.AAC.1